MGSVRINSVLLLGMAVAWSVGSQAAGSDPKSLDPYVAFIAQDECFARSGPGEVFYRTDPLPRGAEIEVYLETSDGWLGIRPPEGSFSWLPASQVRAVGDGASVEVVNPQAVSWIGTQLGRARQFRWQVQLQPGEQVTVLDRFERPGPDGKREQWLKIVPPAGEFRWIHRNCIALSRDVAVAVHVESVEPASHETQPSVESSRVDAGFEERAASREESQAIAPVSYAEETSPTEPDDWHEADSSVTASTEPVTLERCQTQLAALLSQEASATEVQWLIDQISEGMRSEQDSIQRARWQLMYERAQQYLTLCQRRAAEPSSGRADSPYDRTGYLKQVYSARPQSPPFALVDRMGNTLIYVAPAPGLNLRRFLDQEIGIVGTVTYTTGLDTPMIVASRVTRLPK